METTHDRGSAARSRSVHASLALRSTLARRVVQHRGTKEAPRTAACALRFAPQHAPARSSSRLEALTEDKSHAGARAVRGRKHRASARHAPGCGAP